MLRIIIRLSVLCILFWIAYGENCVIFTERSHKILKGQKILRCSSIDQNNLVDELKRIENEFEPDYPVNLYLHRIRFDNPKISSNWFGKFKLNLKWLQLRQIDVMEIENDAFSDSIFSNLECLEIFEVPLRILKNGTFNTLTNLELLALSDLKLDKIERDVLHPMEKLRGFMLIQCGDKKISLDNLFGASKLFNLTRIAVQQCHLNDTINDRTFISIPGIKTLSLSSNHIRIIGPRSFDSILKNVQSIYLGWNDLKSIPNDLFKTNSSVSIDFTKNPWHCDCHMKHYVNFSGIICDTPENYHGFPLRNFPDLCKEDKIVISNTELPAWTHHEEEPISEQNQNEIIEREHGKFGFMCKILSSPQIKKKFKLTKPSHEIYPVSRIGNDEFLIDTESLLSYNKLIELNHIQSKFDEIILNNEKSCSIFESLRSKDIKVKRQLQLNVLYRFCWMDIDSKTIYPLNCVTFHSGLKNSDEFGLNCEECAWILLEKMPIMIIGFVLSGIFAIFIGISIAIALVKVFPKKIRGHKPDLMKSMTKIGRTITPKEQEAINRLKMSDQPLRRRFDSSKLRRPANQMSMDAAIFTNFEGTDIPDYITIEEIPTLLPPRDSIITSSDGKANCCDSVNCSCYCEL